MGVVNVALVAAIVFVYVERRRERIIRMEKGIAESAKIAETSEHIRNQARTRQDSGFRSGETLPGH
jgi:hypothetical protein